MLKPHGCSGLSYTPGSLGRGPEAIDLGPEDLRMLRPVVRSQHPRPGLKGHLDRTASSSALSTQKPPMWKLCVGHMSEPLILSCTFSLETIPRTTLERLLEPGLANGS